MKRTDLAIISPYPSLERPESLPSGVAWYTARLAKALSDLGVSVRVVAPKLDGEARLRSDAGVVVDRSFSLGPSALVQAGRAAHRTGAPTVHLQHEVFLYGGAPSTVGLPPALALLRRRGLGPVVTMHQVVHPLEVDKEFTKIHRVAVPTSVARVGLACVQSAVRRWSSQTIVHERTFKRVFQDATVIPLGVDPQDRLPKREAKSSLGLSRQQLTVVCFGFLSPYKGLESVLDAAELTKGSVEVVIAGGEHPRLAGRDAYAQTLRRRYGASARFTGFVPDSELPVWFSAADLVLLPYPRPFASSGPLAIALGYGTPLLLSPELGASSGAPPEVITAIDAESIAKRLLELAQDTPSLKRLEVASSEMALDRSWKSAAEKHIALYDTSAEFRNQFGSGRRPAAAQRHAQELL